MRLITGVITASNWRIGLVGLAAVLLLGGCQAVAVTAAGIGASTGLTHTASSISYRTFTAPETQVRQATLIALERMGVKVEGTSRSQATETIRASMADRAIEIELEAMNSATTHISASAQRGLFVFDGATAREIVAQTESAMAELNQPRKARAPSKGSGALADSTTGAPAIRR
jgi:Protein of unknown function (DUF3568)